MAADISMSLKDAIGLAADVMTLFGVSGFFTWSFVKKSVEPSSVSDVGVSMFALSVKTLLALVLISLLLIPAGFFHIFLVMLFSGNYGSSDSLWNDQKTTAYALSYLVNALWFIPAIVLSAASIYSWSFEPFRRFRQTFARGAR